LPGFAQAYSSWYEEQLQPLLGHIRDQPLTDGETDGRAQDGEVLATNEEEEDEGAAE